jgi:hypothetical protein
MTCLGISKSGIAVAETQEQFGNPDEVECPPLEAVTGGLANT